MDEEKLRIICPACESEKVRHYERTKSGMYYSVYVCEVCKKIIKREANRVNKES